MRVIRPLVVLILIACSAATAWAQIRGIQPYSQLFVQPTLGEYTIARARGPGSFVSASVNGIGIDQAQAAAYVSIDGKVIWSASLGFADADLGQQVNSGVGVTYVPSLGGSARISFGLPQTVDFERELRVYVRVEAGTPERIFGKVLVADPN